MPATKAAPAPVAKPKPRLRALIVDDNAPMREVLKVIMTAFGFQVVLAEDAEEALELAADGAYQVVLLDLHLAGTDGREIVGTLKEITKAPVLAVTGDAPPDEAAPAPFDGWVTKPFTIPGLADRIRAVVPEGF
jgi:CheY-like chemotaxis protein